MCRRLLAHGYLRRYTGTDIAVAVLNPTAFLQITNYILVICASIDVFLLTPLLEFCFQVERLL